MGGTTIASHEYHLRPSGQPLGHYHFVMLKIGTDTLWPEERDVRYWQKADMRVGSLDVRYVP